MRPAKELIGKPIYSITEGRLLGTVKDLYVDSEIRRVTGVYVGSEGLFSRKARLIPSDQVTILGIDAVLTIQSDVITDDTVYVPSQDWLRRDGVQGRIMNTAGGTKVGSVGDLLIDDSYFDIGDYDPAAFDRQPPGAPRSGLRFPPGRFQPA